MPKTLSIIIVSWNSKAKLDSCLGTLDKLGLNDLETIVVDNNSQDGTATFLQRLESSELGTRVGLRVLCLGVNTGWAKGTNQAARIATGKWLLLCNPDISFTPDFREMLQFAESHNFQVVAPLLVTRKGNLQQPLRRITFTRLFFAFTTLGEFLDAGLSRRFVWRNLHYEPWKFTAPILVDHPSASFVMISRDILNMLRDLVSEEFPLYFGDSDLFRRLQDRNIPMVLLPSVRIIHEVGYSKRLVPDEIYRFRREQSMMRFAKKWKMHYHSLVFLLFLDALISPFLSYQRILKMPSRRDLRGSGFGMKGVLLS